MKKSETTRTYLFVATFAFFSFFIVAPVFAQDVTLLSPLPGTGPESNFGDYVPIVFNLSIGIAAILAVVMIIMGGLQYMSTDAIQGKSDGKNRITAALLGLGLALAAYVILWQINPNLVRFELNKLNVGVTGTPFNGIDLIPPPPTPPPRLTIPARPLVTGSPTSNRMTTTGCFQCETLQGVPVSPRACRPPSSSCTILLNTQLAVQVQHTQAALTQLGITMQVTEGYPPTVVHDNICHQNGTCIDYNFTNTNLGVPAVAAVAINNVIATAATAGEGLIAIYEVSNTAACQTLQAAGARNVVVVPGIGAPHFSIYSPNLSSGGGQPC